MVREGMMLSERYEIISKIGTGGMSDVYKAQDHKLNRFVAVKILKAEFSENSSFVSKFRTEAQSAAGLMHPNIVNVYDVGEEFGLYYIVMELVEGITLKHYIEKKLRLSVREAVSIAIQVSMGLLSAHEHNVIHRDVKPQNIIISTDGKVKVTDFGIARAATSNTITSNVMGSVHYTSPEQARGGYSDEKSDIYSLGIVLFEMLTGRVPFDGDTTVSIAIKQIQEPMPNPRDYVDDIPISAEHIIYKCCEKNPDRRYSSMTELIADLKKCLATPDEDFVKRVPKEGLSGATKMVTDEDVSSIRRQTGGIPLDEEILKAYNNQGRQAADPSYGEETGYENESWQTDADYPDDGETEYAGPDMGGNAGYDNELPPEVEAFFQAGGFAEAERKAKASSREASDMEEAPVRKKPSKSSKGKPTQTGKKGKKKAQDEKVRRSRDSERLRKNRDRYDEDEDDEEEDDDLDPNLQRLMTVLGIVAAIIIVIIIVVLVRKIQGLSFGTGSGISTVEGTDENTEENGSDSNLSAGSGSAKTVVIEDVTNTVFAEAKSRLNNQGFTVTSRNQPSDSVEKGKVISMEDEGGNAIAAGSNVAEGESIVLVVSSGQDGTEVPSVVGLSKAEARVAIENSGFQIEESESESSVESGHVVSQSPEGGQLAASGSVVSIVISTGQEEEEAEVKTVPQIVGMTENDAKVALAAAGLSFSSLTEEYSDTVAAGHVISQSPNAGSTVGDDTGVSFVISKGQEVHTYGGLVAVQAPADYQGGAASVVIMSPDGASVLYTGTVQALPASVSVTGLPVNSGVMTVSYVIATNVQYEADDGSIVNKTNQEQRSFTQNVAFSAQ